MTTDARKDLPDVPEHPDPGNAPPAAWSEPQTDEESDEVLRRVRAVWRDIYGPDDATSGGKGS